jgi:hypothetical protein
MEENDELFHTPVVDRAIELVLIGLSRLKPTLLDTPEPERRKSTMPANAFISFDHDDQQQVAGFRLLKNNPKHPLDFQDHSLKDAVRDRSGKPIKYPPSDPRSKPVRDERAAR